MVQDLADSIENAKDDSSTKTKLRAEKQSEAAAKKKELAATTRVMNEDKATISDMHAECTEKDRSFTEKQALRAEEIQALEKAIEVLSGQAVSGAATKYLGLAQGGRATSLVQISGQGSSVAEVGLEGIRRKVR